MEDGRFLEKKPPGIRFVSIRPHDPLPFDDREFDIVFGNAVIEHVGTTRDQQSFLGEALRVSKGFFVTTPHRWFPIEHHTGLPLLHFLPLKGFRFVVRGLGMGFYAEEKNWKPFNRTSFHSLFPNPAKVQLHGVPLLGFVSHFAAWGRSEDQV